MIRSYKGVIFQLKNTTKNGVKCIEASIDVSFSKSRYTRYARLDRDIKPYAPDLFIALLDNAIVDEENDACIPYIQGVGVDNVCSDTLKQIRETCITARLLRSIKQDLIEYTNPY